VLLSARVTSGRYLARILASAVCHEIVNDCARLIALFAESMEHMKDGAWRTLPGSASQDAHDGSLRNFLHFALSVAIKKRAIFFLAV
jgi:hypothetical protein